MKFVIPFPRSFVWQYGMVWAVLKKYKEQWIYCNWNKYYKIDLNPLTTLWNICTFLGFYNILRKMNTYDINSWSNLTNYWKLWIRYISNLNVWFPPPPLISQMCKSLKISCIYLQFGRFICVLLLKVTKKIYFKNIFLSSTELS